jgi:hypothetical protein
METVKSLNYPFVVAVSVRFILIGNGLNLSCHE